MTDRFWQKLDLAARNGTPGLLLLAMTLLGVVPLQAPLYASIAPLMPLAGLYYWIVHRPDLVPVSLVFAIGVLHDMLTGAILGAYAAVFLLVYWLVRSQQRVLSGKPFLMLWGGFFVVSGFACLTEWTVISLAAGALMPLEPALFRSLFTAALFPLWGWLFLQVHRHFVRMPA
ncbi:MAG: rod shape-determining protein MreD [Alphaproteobacteria bacterium]|nr:rod shape-determining protein MreD [Alphaproteobacteria bacterium]